MYYTYKYFYTYEVNIKYIIKMNHIINMIKLITYPSYFNLDLKLNNSKKYLSEIYEIKNKLFS